MSEAVLIALITAGAGIIVQLIISRSSRDDMDRKLDRQQAVTNTKLDELTREVREHNNFARRVPVLEEKMTVANHRIADLEKEIRNYETAG